MLLTHTLLFLPLALPAIHLIAAGCSALRARPALFTWLSAAGLGTALTSAVAALAPGQAMPVVALVSPAPASYLVALLVAFLGLIISHFSRNYLAGDPGQARFNTLLHVMLAAVATVAVTDHLLILLVAWMAVSMALNELLLFYRQRPRAVLAAHKKFLFARLAELSLLIAIVLLHQQHGTWQISAIVSAYPAQLSVTEQLAALLLALTALIKCAQLPVHGWLIQVVEAPTPVSALLHAGVINLGGYLLILFAPLMLASAPASWLLLIVAGLSTLLASLIMATRISIKVKLAWSTCAQMGLMLIECALGLYQLALLHLLAHACYKAYLFLRSGSAVERHLEQRLVPASPVTPVSWFSGGLIGATGGVLSWQLLAPTGPLSPWLLVAALLTVLVLQRSGRGLLLSSGLLGGVLVAAYLVQKQLLTGIVEPTGIIAAGWVADLWTAVLIGLLFSGWSLLQREPATPLVHRLRTWLFAGLYLDEWVTRTTLRLWPLRLPVHLHTHKQPIVNVEAE